MQIRFLEGRRAGEIAILPFHVARPLIEARRVEAIDKSVAERFLNTANEQTVTAEQSPPIAAPLRGRGRRGSHK